jgi:hypothetical protein
MKLRLLFALDNVYLSVIDETAPCKVVRLGANHDLRDLAQWLNFPR